MKIENQVCTMQQAIELQGLGIIQRRSYFSYCHFQPDPLSDGITFVAAQDDHRPEVENATFVCDALSSAELGEILPFKFQYDGVESVITATRYIANDYLKAWIAGIFWVQSPNISYSSARKYISGRNEAEVKAAMLIYCLKHGIVTAEDCNKRLSA